MSMRPPTPPAACSLTASPDESAFRLSRRALLAAPVGLSACAALPQTGRPRAGLAADQTVWTFDRLSDIGGFRTTVEGAPRLIDSPWGQAVWFDGAGDALFIDNHPLAGARTFTFEALFRPDGGAFEQRWFHLESDPAPDAPEARMLFEVRVVEQGWYLDIFALGPGYRQPLIFPDRIHPLGQWSHVAQTFDGATYRAYVNGVLQGEAPLAFKPQGPGRASVGIRINRAYPFRGAVRQGRFTPAALPPDRFTMG